MNRFRRDPDLYRLLSRGFTSTRQRRDTLSHVETAMENVQDKISGLQAVNSSLHDRISFEPSLDTNTISRTAPECIVLANGKVHCPVVIYQDRRTWRRSRHQVENEIQQLKEKLEKLKEIRRHLKHSKPTHLMDDIGEFNTTDPNDFNQVPVNLAPSGFELHWFPVNLDNLTTERSVEEVSQSSKRKNEESHRSGRRKRPKIEVEEPALENRTATTMTNHHRHSRVRHHKHHSTTRGYVDVENSTVAVSSEATTTARISTTHKVRLLYLLLKNC